MSVNRLKASLSRQEGWIQPGSAVAHLLCCGLRSAKQLRRWYIPLSALPKTGVLCGSTLPGGTDTSFLPLEGIGAIDRLCGFFPISSMTGTTRQDFWVPLPPKTMLFGANVCCMLLQMYAIASNTVQAGHQL